MVESPFPSSFQAFGEEPVESLNEEEYSRFVESDSPFPSIYELENPLEPQGIVAPEMEEYVAFLNELYDEEFNDAIADLADEATEIYQNQFSSIVCEIGQVDAEFVDNHEWFLQIAIELVKTLLAVATDERQ